MFYNYPLRLLGGGKEDRTPDPLLAKQVLSQLSYTPIALLLLFSIFRFLSGILKIEQCLSLLSYSSLSLTFRVQTFLFVTP